MRRILLAAVAVVFGAGFAPPASVTTTRVAVLVELFTSEGCSSCPPADALLGSLIDAPPAAGVQVIGLGEHVDYWDQLGWKDRFSSAALTRRQQDYGRALGVDSIYTPQAIVDGSAECVGSDARAVRGAIARSAARPHATMSITLQPSAGAIDATVTASDMPKLSRGDHADIVVAVIENGLRSQVRAGENSGRTLQHAAVVRTMSVAGEAIAGGATASARARLAIAPDWQREQLLAVAFVQERASRRVLGAAAVAVPGVRR